ncbi:MAG: hypothetical protein ACRDNF_22740 [Streptosporangiaceae bacterium]
MTQRSEGQRLREAVQALISGFGTFASQLSRHRHGQLVRWGAQLPGDDKIALFETRDALPPPDLVAVAGDIWGAPGPEWIRRTIFTIPAPPLGRWS